MKPSREKRPRSAPRYRASLAQLDGVLLLADGGMGTSLIFHEGLELPHFCAFPLLDDPAGREILRRYFRPYLRLAREHAMGFLLDSGPTWRASADWGEKLGYSAAELADVNRLGIEMMCALRDELEDESAPVVISGCLGPRGDGYEPGNLMTPDEAGRYHAPQIETFAGTAADQVTAMTLTYAEEAVGITRAAEAAEIPVVISFTVETDGRLPTGQSLRDAIELVDEATSAGPAYYMINCAHPTHFARILEAGSGWTDRIRGVRLNASRMSHAELDNATELDDGDAADLGRQVGDLCRKFPRIHVVGGCCGTDLRHIAEMATHARLALA